MSVDLTVLHYKVNVPCNGDVCQRVTGHRDDVSQVALGELAEVGPVDQVGGNDRGRAQHRDRRHAPVDQCDEFVGVLAVRDGGRVAADGDLDAGVVGRLD